MRILNMTTAKSFVAKGLGALVLAAAAEPAAAAGLPQLDVTTYSSQVVWLVISFIVLYALMSKVALPRIGEVLEERQNKIDDNLAKAENLRAQAQSAAEAYEASLNAARAKAHDAIRDVKDKATAEAAERQGALSEKLKAQIAQSEQAIAKARDEALSGIKGVATDVAASVVERLSGEAPKEASVNGAVEAALKGRA